MNRIIVVWCYQAVHHFRGGLHQYQFYFCFIFLSIISNDSLFFYGVSNYANKYIDKDVNCHAPEMPFATNTE